MLAWLFLLKNLWVLIDWHLVPQEFGIDWQRIYGLWLHIFCEYGSLISIWRLITMSLGIFCISSSKWFQIRVHDLSILWRSLQLIDFYERGFVIALFEMFVVKIQTWDSYRFLSIPTGVASIFWVISASHISIRHLLIHRYCRRHTLEVLSLLLSILS
jgi:hypothetical protein